MSVHGSADPGMPADFLRRLVVGTLEAEDRDADLSLIVISEAEMARLNRDFLGHEGPTDVIAFPLSEGDHDPWLGEVYVCPEVAVRQAGDYGLSADRELALYVIHGTLHLLGWDDTAEPARSAMEKRQAELLAALWPAGLQAPPPIDRRVAEA